MSNALLSTFGFKSTKSSFICTDPSKLKSSYEAGVIDLRIAAKATRNSRQIYLVDAHAKGASVYRRLYFALPAGTSLVRIDGERSHVHWHIKEDDESTRAFIEAIEYILQLVKQRMDEDEAGNYVQGKIVKDGNVIIMNEPKDLKQEEFQRLQEAKGAHVLCAIAYVYQVHDEEKNLTWFGPTFEIGRYPSQPIESSSDKQARKKRKIEDVSSAQPESTD